MIMKHKKNPDPAVRSTRLVRKQWRKWARLTANECNRAAVKAEKEEETRVADALWQAAGCLLDAAHILRA